MPADRFEIGPYVVPGILQSVEVPDRALIWQVSGGAGGGVGAGTIWRGVKIEEGGILITTLVTEPEGPTVVITDADRAAQVWQSFLALVHPNALAKPPAFDVGHPLLAAQQPRIQRASHRLNGLVRFGNMLGWVGRLGLIEYKPLKIVKPAPPEPAKLENVKPTPQDAAERQIEELLDKVKSG